MSIIKNIFIIHEKGMEALVPYVVSALNDVMNCFPQYRQYFPIKNLGNWKSDNMYAWENGKFILKPYESFDWYLDRAKQRAILEERWQTGQQMNIEQMLEDLGKDPYRRRIPQWTIHLTKQDLYGGEAQGFCLGCTIPDAFSIISTKRFPINNRSQMGLENFLTTVQHEFGHILGVTERERPNVYDSLGRHCSTPGCIMQQRLDGNVTDVTKARLERKVRGETPICSCCITQGRKNLFRLYAANERRQNPLHTFGGPHGPNGGRD